METQYKQTFEESIQKLILFQETVTVSLGKILREYEELKASGVLIKNKDLDNRMEKEQIEQNFKQINNKLKALEQ